ncbi:DUF4188 domain-containing protein [Tsukamurella sputi]|nr:DUF4188 domain-containing protein [Tsukamurella sputi]
MNHDLQTDTHDGDLVVFLLGMRPRRTWRLGQSAFVARSLRRMLSEIERDRERGGALGYLGGFKAIAPGGPLLVQYWRSFAELESYSHSTDFTHRPAWLEFYKMAHGQGRSTVGIWHETYRVPAGAHESIYADLSAPVGLAAAVGSQPLARRGRTSRERIGA